MFGVVILLSAAVIFPFLNPVLTSLVLAYVFYPIYKRLLEKVKKKNIAAFIVSAFIVIIIILPLSFTIYQVSQEANIGYIIIRQNLAGGSFFDGECQGIFCGLFEKIKEITSGSEIKFYIEDSFKKLSSSISDWTFNFIFSLPTRILELVLTFFFTFFLLRDGKHILKSIEKRIPLRTAYKEKIIKQVHQIIHAILYGFFVIAAAEGAIGALTFWLFGVSSPLIWGLVIAFLAFVPFIGGTLVWIPAAIFKFSGGDLFATFGIVIGGVAISYIDTFIRPRIIGSKASVHPAIVLLGLLGGLKLMGFAGIIIGPIILSLLLMFIHRVSNQR